MNVGFTGRIAPMAAARPWLTVAGWTVAIVVAGVAAGSIDQYVSPVQTNLITTEADRQDNLEQQYRLGAADGERFAEQLIVTSDTQQSGSAAFEAVLADAVAALNGLDGVSHVSVSDAVVAPTGRSAIVDFTLVANEVLGGRAW